MKKSLSIIITKPPFGTINAAEAVRLANGAIAYGHDVALILINDGVLVAKKGQKAEDSGWTSLSPLIEKIAVPSSLSISSPKNAKVFADIESVKQLGLAQQDLVDGVRLVESEAIFSVISSSDRTAIF